MVLVKGERKRKKTSKIFAVLLSLVMIMGVTAVLTGCGSDEPNTLEKYIADHPEEQKAMDDAVASYEQDGMAVDVQIKENLIIYSFKYDETFDEDTVEQLKGYFENAMGSVGSVFENIAKTCEEQTEIKGITVQVLYLNGDDSEIYSQTFEAAE